MMNDVMCQGLFTRIMPMNTVEPVVKARVTSIRFLLTMSLDIQEKKS